RLAEMMVGSRDIPQAHGTKSGTAVEEPRLSVRKLYVEDDTGLPAVEGFSIDVRPGEIVGIAGVSGNGQRELVEALIGQRVPVAGTVQVNGQPYAASRGQIRLHRAFSLPEEPLRNACVPSMSVAENMALRNFDQSPLASGIWLRGGAMLEQAQRWIGEFKVKTQGAEALIGT